MTITPEAPICQSCAVPMPDLEARGTNADGSSTDLYCSYCYANGEFTSQITMEEMVDLNLQYLDEWNSTRETPLTPEEARAELLTYLPTLTRWTP